MFGEKGAEIRTQAAQIRDTRISVRLEKFHKTKFVSTEIPTPPQVQTTSKMGRHPELLLSLLQALEVEAGKHGVKGIGWVINLLFY